MIQIGSIGYNHTHGSDFCMERPDGAGAWLFLLVKSEADFIIGGKEYAVQPGTAVLLSPKTPCRYSASCGGYADDWFYFGMDKSDLEALKRGSIEPDKPIYLGSADELSGIIYLLTGEFYSASLYHDDIAKLYIELLFRKISRAVLEGERFRANNINLSHGEALSYLRTRIYREPGELPKIPVLAEQTGLCTSSLEHLYKKAFGVSIKQDILASRIDYAKRLLLTTNLSVAQIAEKLGYGSDYGFMKQFAKNVGMTPTEYRKTFALGVGNAKK